MLEVPSLPNSEFRADWAEMCLLFSGDDSISRSDFYSIIQESTGLNPDRVTDDIWQEIMWREGTCPEIYPVRYTHSRLIRKEPEILPQPYSFMLLLARSHFYESTKITSRGRRIPSKLFERLVSIVLKQYLGMSINPGHPREGIFASKTFRQSVDFFSKVSYEEVASYQQIRKNAKDEGVDVIAWRPIDSRSGQAIIFVQCTIEKDWMDKTGEISLEGWQDIVNFAVPPIRAMAFPCVYHNQWNLWSKRGGILFDRLRLTLLFPKNLRYFEKRMNKWAGNQISKLPAF